MERAQNEKDIDALEDDVRFMRTPLQPAENVVGIFLLCSSR
jgi:hypothetical protein